MLLSTGEVASLSRVSEREVHRWIEERGLLAERVNGLSRVHAAEFLEWATLLGISVDPLIFSVLNGDTQAALSSALEAGGVLHGVAAEEPAAVFAAAIETLPLPDSIDRQSLEAVLAAHAAYGLLPVGDGIAVLHPRRPVVLPGGPSLIRLCLLDVPSHALASDRLIDTLFLVIAPTVSAWLHLLARLLGVLRDPALVELLRARAETDAIKGAVRQLEAALLDARP